MKLPDQNDRIRRIIRTPSLTQGIVIGVAFILIFLLFALKPGPLWHRSLPDFRGIDDISERQAAFFDFLNPYIEEANAEILSQRDRLVAISHHILHGPLNRRDNRWVRAIAEVNALEIGAEEPITEDHVKELLRRVDIIPPSLALAQAALESGWGTSRFARRGNNLFGIWCFTPGCGIVPENRPPGATYEVKKYRSPEESFLDYIRNLNTNRAYEPMWEIRELLRHEESPVSGLALADGLYRYSGEGTVYIGKVQRLIKSNGLQNFDDSFE